MSKFQHILNFSESVTPLNYDKHEQSKHLFNGSVNKLNKLKTTLSIFCKLRSLTRVTLFLF